MQQIQHRILFGCTHEGLRVCLEMLYKTSAADPLGPPRFDITIPTSIPFQERLQLVRAARMTKLAQRLRLDLANPLTRHVELLAHFLERVVCAHLNTETHPQHLRLARRQRIEHVLPRRACWRATRR